MVKSTDEGIAMFPAVNVKPRPEETRARIMETAEALFRRLGFAKTTVADIASELGMSPANVYRFFPSKNAIVQAICQRCLAELEAKIWAVARSRGPAAERLERLVLEALAYHKENLLEEQRVSDLVKFAMEESWQAIMAHKEVHRTVIELILRDGIEAGDFEAADPRETSMIVQQALVGFCHPLLLEQGLQEGHNLESDARAVIRLLLRGINKRK
jgi:AcrR family transcriptional regulator